MARSVSELHDEVYSVMESVDTRVVALAPDTGELLSGGVDPVAVIREFGSIVRHAHLKNLALPLLMMVELNPSTNASFPTPGATARASKAYLRTLGYSFKN